MDHAFDSRVKTGSNSGTNSGISIAGYRQIKVEGVPKQTNSVHVVKQHLPILAAFQKKPRNLPICTPH